MTSRGFFSLKLICSNCETSFSAFTPFDKFENIPFPYSPVHVPNCWYQFCYHATWSNLLGRINGEVLKGTCFARVMCTHYWDVLLTFWVSLKCWEFGSCSKMTEEPTVHCGLEQTCSIPGSRAFLFNPEGMDRHPVDTHLLLSCLGRVCSTLVVAAGVANSTRMDTCLWHTMGVWWLWKFQYVPQLFLRGEDSSST